MVWDDLSFPRTTFTHSASKVRYNIGAGWGAKEWKSDVEAVSMGESSAVTSQDAEGTRSGCWENDWRRTWAVRLGRTLAVGGASD